MKLFTRIAATLNASADSAVARFENHDAIAETALQDIRRGVAEARVRHERVKRDGERLRQSIQDLNGQIAQWTDRARGCANTDESRALACLERRTRCQAQLEQTERTLSEHVALEARVQSRLEQMQQRLEQVTLQRNRLRSRESISRAGKSMSQIDGEDRSAIDDVFERWETSIGEAELRDDLSADAPDTLAHQFDTEEAQARLKKELEALTRENQDDR